MAALQELLDEQARIRQELQRMEDSEETTEENDGDLRDTLIARWEELDTKAAPIIARMERIKAITKVAADEANLERPDGGTGFPDGRSGGWRGGSGPDLVTHRFRDPYDATEAVRGGLLRRSELRGRALDAIEVEAKRGNLSHDFAEEVTRKAQDSFGGQCNIARHVLLTGSEEYQEAFRAYMENPQEEAQRASMTLTLANGGYLLPFVLDQVPVA